jgi:hypothetical protein
MTHAADENDQDDEEGTGFRKMTRSGSGNVDSLD